MTSVTVRAMTGVEFDQWQVVIAERFASEQVAAGNWPAEGAFERAVANNATFLPQGFDTPRMLFLQAMDPDDAPVGVAWIGLDHPRQAPDTAFLYVIEVVPSRRGVGLGRALLSAVEDAVRGAGGSALELNVFAQNHAATSLYSSAGYDVVTQQMRRTLTR